MKKFGLIGHPISHSLSPALFKAAFGGKYSYDLIEEADFDKAYERFLKEYDAINVTAPFKEQAFRKADIKNAECNAIGAANILVKSDDGTITAANSDQMGVIGAVISGMAPDKKTNTTALIVGCGGAAKAAAYAMCSLGYETIIINRNYQKAENFAKQLSENPEFNVSAVKLDDFCRYFRKAGVIVYTLPVMIPDIENLSRRDICGTLLLGKKNKILLEANYKDPAFTPELKNRLASINPDLKYVDGKEWLLHQAIGAYKYFVDENPDVETMRTVIQ